MKLTENDKKRAAKQEAILKSLNNGASIVKACKAADTTTVSLWMWRKADKEFNKRVEAALESRIMIVEDALYVAAFLDRNPSCLFFYLQNRAPDKWQDMRNIKLTGSLAHTIEKTTEELERIAADGFEAYLAGIDAATESGAGGTEPKTADTVKPGGRSAVKT